MPNPKYAPEEPICAIATALAPAALGIVRCSGKNCVELVSHVFSRPKALREAAGNTLVYGWIVDRTAQNVPARKTQGNAEATVHTNEATNDATNDAGIKIDEVMVSVYRAPKSFTGEEMVEICCHGGPGVVLAIHALLLNTGFRQAERGEFTFRAFINGKADLTKAEAVQEIISSRTGESRSRAAGRLAGNLFEEIDGIKRLITDTLGAIEVEIEYPEDEETIADSFNKADLEKAAARLCELSASWQGEKLYQDGARVVLCGRTNAGKSSLFNAILKEERSIVSDIEGTTRDWIESWVNIDGIPVRLFDTAGLRDTEDVIEAHGVELTHSLLEDADIILYLEDSRFGLNADDLVFLKSCMQPVIFVWNKSDMVEKEPSLSSQIKLEMPLLKKEVRISAKKGMGFKELFAAIGEVLTSGLPTERAQAGLGSARQKAAVEEALESVHHALRTANEDYSLDAVVQDLEEALNSLGEITGEVTADDVLGSIFSRFCVGK